MLSPIVVDIQDKLRQAWWPLDQEPLADDFQVSHHQFQDASVVQISQEEFMNILLLWKKNRHLVGMSPSQVDFQGMNESTDEANV